jgi:superfamily II DNA/RNA helicase
LSRGFDFLDVNHVIEFDFAGNAISFLHRAGRTARAGKNGKRRISICKIK